MAKKYDVIIIGSGIGGLTAGAILARNGKKVLVLEKIHVPGGYAVNFKRGEFDFDASLHMLDGCEQGGEVYRSLQETGIIDMIVFLKPPDLYRSIFPDFDIKVPQCDIESYIETLAKYFPVETAGLKKFYNEMALIHQDTRKFLMSSDFLWAKQLFSPFKYRKLFAYRNKTLQNMLDKFIHSSQLKAIVSQLWCYYGLPPSELSAFYYAYPTYDYLRNGGYYPKGGARALTKALCEVISENGGKIKLNSEVTKIVIEKQRAKGVKSKQGDEFLGDVVISNIDARRTFLNLVGIKHLSRRFANKLQRMETSLSAFQVYLGLNVDLKDKGIYDYEIFYNPHDNIENQYAACFDGNIEDGFWGIALYSNIDPDTAPKGKSTLVITYLSGYDLWKDLGKDEYNQKKQEVAKAFIKRAEEEVIPNLSSYIEEMEIATPLTMERYTGNAKGAIYGWSQIVSQSGIRRMHFKTPVKNLYLSSAWTWTGGGIGSVMNAGRMVAGDILKRL